MSVDNILFKQHRPEQVYGAIEAEQQFQDQLLHEILISERLRAAILAGLLFVALVVFVLVMIYLQATGLNQIGEPYPTHILIPVMLALLLYELLIRYLLNLFIKRNIQPRLWIRYVNALVETSIPSLIIFLAAQSLREPVTALATPAVLLYSVFIILSILRLDLKLSVFSGLIAAIGYVIMTLSLLEPDPPPTANMLYFPIIHFHKALILLFSGVAAGFVAREIRRRLFSSFIALEERNQILKVFGQQTAPAVVETMLKHGADMSSRRREVCIMFLDIRGFTAYSEQRDPEEVVQYLNTLFGFTIDIVNAHHGIIHQLLGDGFMAIFGAPLSFGNDRQHAVDAAIEIIDSLRRESASGHIPPTRIGIGLHAGEALVGTVGSHIHKEYKVTGDVVNLASRIEQLNKTYDSQVLISDAVRHQIDLRDVQAVSLGPVPIRGRNQTVEIFRLA